VDQNKMDIINETMDRGKLRQIWIDKYDRYDRYQKYDKCDQKQKPKNKCIKSIERYVLKDDTKSIPIPSVPSIQYQIINECSIGTITFFDKTIPINIYFSKNVKFRMISRSIATELGFGTLDDIFSRPIDKIDNINVYSVTITFTDHPITFKNTSIDEDNVAKSLNITVPNYIILSIKDINYLESCCYRLQAKDNDE
jgi:hypothetical protein